MCSLRQSKLNTMRIKLTLPWLSKKVNDSFLCNRRPRFTSSSSPTSSIRSKRWPWRGRFSWRSQSPWRGTLTLSHHCNIGRVLSAQATRVMGTRIGSTFASNKSFTLTIHIHQGELKMWFVERGVSNTDCRAVETEGITSEKDWFCNVGN